jgi:hypothetical protein
MDAQQIEWRLRVAENDLPAWVHLAWASPASHVPGALSEPERTKVFGFHSSLEQLTTLRANLLHAFTDQMKAIALKCRVNPDVLQDGSNQGNRDTPVRRGAVDIAMKVREFNQHTQNVQQEWQSICNQLMPMVDLLTDDFPRELGESQTPAYRLQPVRAYIAARLPEVQVTWHRRDALTTKGKEESR